MCKNEQDLLGTVFDTRTPRLITGMHQDSRVSIYHITDMSAIQIYQISGAEEGHDWKEEKEKSSPDVVSHQDASFPNFWHRYRDPALGQIQLNKTSKYSKHFVACCCTLNNKTILWLIFIRQVSTNTGNYLLPLVHCNTLHWRRFLASDLVRQFFCDIMSNSLLTTILLPDLRKLDTSKNFTFTCSVLDWQWHVMRRMPLEYWFFWIATLEWNTLASYMKFVLNLSPLSKQSTSC